MLGIAVVDTVAEAVELANASDYSLTASLWTKDINVALETASQIRAGACTFPMKCIPQILKFP